MTDDEIRKAVRKQLAYHIQEDADGGEYLMKEVWEELADAREMEVATRELEEIAIFLRRNRPLLMEMDGSVHRIGDATCCRHKPCPCGGQVHSQAVYGPSTVYECDRCGCSDDPTLT